MGNEYVFLVVILHKMKMGQVMVKFYSIDYSGRDDRNEEIGHKG